MQKSDEKQGAGYLEYVKEGYYMGKKVLIVESPSKAKTISRYLDSEFEVVASMGHVRELVPKQGSVDPEQDFAMRWASDARAKKQLGAITKVLEGAQEVYLATDPDREGEAISWHLLEILSKNKEFKNLTFKRVVFHEITKSAIWQALRQTRDVSGNLVDAYLARVALDYLVGFNLSPVLCRKLPGSKSAGRVQSVALRLIVEREIEISRFKSQEYWSISGLFDIGVNKGVEARLHSFKGQKLEKLSIKNKAEADEILASLKDLDYSLTCVDKSKYTRGAQAPFITSTLQQEGARRLGFSAKQTMMLAQQLYEGIDIEKQRTGLITYMRTDSTVLSTEFVDSAREYIKGNYGDNYLPSKPCVYKTKARNAQEAHEAIRPTSIKITPQRAAKYLDNNQLKLYKIIWQRALACQMTKAKFDKMVITIADGKNAEFKATGSVMTFDGFLRIFADVADKEEDSPKDRESSEELGILKEIEKGMEAVLKDIRSKQHFTQPPFRYNEASLVQKMEELGIGRPSTYAGIITTLQTRNYVEKVKRRFVPHMLGMLVASFLTDNFAKYVDYAFTSELEDNLDKISNGKTAWKGVVGDFWKGFIAKIDSSKDLSISEVLDKVNVELADFLFNYLVQMGYILPTHARKVRDNSNIPHTACTNCEQGVLLIKIGKFGPFISCSNYPECKVIINMEKKAKNSEQDKDEEKDEFDESLPILLGEDNGFEITLRKGPYGYYLQWDKKDEENKKSKPKRVGIDKGVEVKTIDLTKALELGEYPKIVGMHPDDGKDLIVGKGRFGPYVKYNSKFYSAKGYNDIGSLTVRDCLAIIEGKKS